MTAEQIATLERTLEESGARYRSEVYEGAQHGYTMADTAAYDEPRVNGISASSACCSSARLGAGSQAGRNQ